MIFCQMTKQTEHSTKSMEISQEWNGRQRRKNESHRHIHRKHPTISMRHKRTRRKMNTTKTKVQEWTTTAKSQE